ncbi:MAG: hypothetical protein H0V19_07970 [Euzebyales bacterium]|nr:hypothetical protein [Euzebyales bacterium]
METVPTTEPIADTGEQTVAGVRQRRSGLHAVLVELEAAIAAPGRSQAWSDRVAAGLERLRVALAEHIVGTEGPDGLFDQVIRRTPRLAHHCAQLTSEHVAIGDATTAAQEAVHNDPGDVREAVLSLLALLARHRQHGADLIYEAYDVDLGGSD